MVFYQFCGKTDSMCQSAQQRGIRPAFKKRLLESAKRQLESESAVFFSSSLGDFHSLFAASNLPFHSVASRATHSCRIGRVNPTNYTENAETGPDEETRRWIVKMNKYDIALWNFSLTLPSAIRPPPNGAIQV